MNKVTQLFTAYGEFTTRDEILDHEREAIFRCAGKLALDMWCAGKVAGELSLDTLRHMPEWEGSATYTPAVIIVDAP